MHFFFHKKTKGNTSCIDLTILSHFKTIEVYFYFQKGSFEYKRQIILVFLDDLSKIKSHIFLKSTSRWPAKRKDSTCCRKKNWSEVWAPISIWQFPKLLTRSRKIWFLCNHGHSSSLHGFIANHQNSQRLVGLLDQLAEHCTISGTRLRFNSCTGLKFFQALL